MPVVFDREDLPVPRSLPEFQKLFPGDTACAAYLEAIRWRDGFVCGWCSEPGEPYRFAKRPHVLRCRQCQRDNRLTAGTVMQDTHTSLSVWFWGAYLVATDTAGGSISAATRPYGLRDGVPDPPQIASRHGASRPRPHRRRLEGSCRDR